MREKSTHPYFLSSCIHGLHGIANHFRGLGSGEGIIQQRNTLGDNLAGGEICRRLHRPTCMQDE